MRQARAAAAWLYTAYAAVLLLLCALAGALPMALLPTLALRRRAGRVAVRCFLLLAGLRLRSLGFARLPPGATVVVANHASYLDGPVLFAALPPRFTFVIKHEAARVPLMGLLLRRLGHQFVDRFNRHRGAIDARRILRLAASGDSIVFFPEGTIVPAAGLGRFHTGAFMTAVRAGVAVAPVAIRGTRRILTPGSARLRPGCIDVEVLEALPVAAAADGAAHSIRDAARARILAAVDEPDAGPERFP